MSDALANRALGCILGGALGDAWGGPYEGKPGPIVFSIPTDPLVSDDTELTLATCEAIIRARAVTPELVAEHLLDAFLAGRLRGIGSSTLKAMRDLAAGAHWALAGARGEYAAGNGAAMRAAPLAFVLDPDDARSRTTLRDIARITHHSDEAYVGALAVVVAVRLALGGRWATPTALSEVANALPEYSAVRERLEEVAAADCSTAELAARHGSSGWVVDSVPLALHAAWRVATEPLEIVLQAAIEVGGDTDTVASIAGQIAGAHVGRSAMPDELLSAVRGIESVTEIATRFARSLTTER
jgi:ADP-ribosylglycohydrolase